MYVATAWDLMKLGSRPTAWAGSEFVKSTGCCLVQINLVYNSNKRPAGTIAMSLLFCQPREPCNFGGHGSIKRVDIEHKMTAHLASSHTIQVNAVARKGKRLVPPELHPEKSGRRP